MIALHRVILALLPTFIIGCGDGTIESSNEAGARTAVENDTDLGSVRSLDQLQGVYPDSPLILKTNAFAFLATHFTTLCQLSNMYCTVAK